MPIRSSRHRSVAYLTAGICFSIQALGVGTYIAFGVFFNPLMETFGWSRAVIAGASSLAFLMMGVFGMLAGRLNDRFGPRPIMIVTALLMGLGCILMARLSAPWELYLFYGVIFGMGGSSIDVIALTTVARWFSHNRGFMTGVVKVGTGAGQFIIPLAAGWLILHYGWRWSFVVIGVVITSCLIVMSYFLKRDPEAAGIAPPVSQPAAAKPTSVAPVDVPLSSALRTVQLWTICLMNLFLVFCLLIVMMHIVPHARDLGVAPLKAAGVLSTIGAISMLGRFCGGMVIDRRSSATVMAVSFFLLLVSLVWLQVSDRTWMLYAFAVVYGLAHGGFFTAISPIVAEFFGIRYHGTLFGIVVFFGTAGGAIGPLMAGYLFDHSGSYQSTFRVITVMALVSCALLFSLKPFKKS
ncbi:MAG: MFS transporter [Desulfobacteraceae bacterium]|jgi:MFS family permease|nr:MFS transporter [Desulfobacteraceae bacterium]